MTCYQFNMKKILLATIFFLFLISPATVFAQLDQRCWTKDKCTETRKQVNINLSEKEINDGFYQGSEARCVCGGLECKTTDAGGDEIGFCLPVTQTVTKIYFGGRNRFDNIGVFIQYIYRYAIIIASVMAVIMLIVAGFTWMTSGGNPEMITSAKKRIAGSLMGLFLAVMSYSILNLLNPALVNLRLPNTWMVNTQGLAPPTCTDIQSDKLVHEIATFNTNPKEKQKSIADFIDPKNTSTPKFETNPKLAKCNYEYVVPDTGGQTCLGIMCPQKSGKISTCALPSGKDSYGCFVGNIVGTIYDTNIMADSPFDAVFGENWGYPWVTGEMDVGAICNGGRFYTKGRKRSFGLTHNEVASIRKAQISNSNNKTQFYYIPVSEQQIANTEKECEFYGGVQGYYLDLSFNETLGIGGDEDHFIGKNGFDLGDWELGISESGAFLDQIRFQDIKQYLISPEELKKGIKVDINAANVCDVDNSEEEEMRLKCYGYLGYQNKTSSGSNSSGSSGGSLGGGVFRGDGNAGYSSCFPAGTKITMADNTEKNIEDIDVGEMVLAYDINTQSTKSSVVSEIESPIREGYYSVNNNLLRVTDEHPIYIRKPNGEINWGSINPQKTAIETRLDGLLQLEIGDELFMSDKGWIKINDITYIEGAIQTYNLKTVEQYHTYFADGVLVHNKQ